MWQLGYAFMTGKMRLRDSLEGFFGLNRFVPIFSELTYFFMREMCVKGYFLFIFVLFFMSRVLTFETMNNNTIVIYCGIWYWYFRAVGTCNSFSLVMSSLCSELVMILLLWFTYGSVL